MNFAECLDLEWRCDFQRLGANLCSLVGSGESLLVTGLNSQLLVPWCGYLCNICIYNHRKIHLKIYSYEEIIKE